MRTVAVIPCYNEAQFIHDIAFACNRIVNTTVVVDDGSDDGTDQEIIRAGAVIARTFRKRSGQGAGTRLAMDLDIVRECDIVVTLDGDGQHLPEEIPLLLEPVLNGEADIVVGSRFLSGRQSIIPKYRYFGIKVITWLYNVGKHDKITDAQSCFRAYRREILNLLHFTEKGFAFSTETLIKARKHGARIVEVPVSCVYHRQFSHNSTLNPVRHGLSVALKTIRWRLWEHLNV